MAQLNFGGVIENVMTREEFPLEKAREILKDETIAVIGYGVQGPGQACNLRDNGFNVIVGQRQGKTYEKAVADGWVPGETLFSIEDACQKGTIVMCLLSDAAVMSVWPTIKPFLTPGKALYSLTVSLLPGATVRVWFLPRILMLLWLPPKVRVRHCVQCSSKAVA